MANSAFIKPKAIDEDQTVEFSGLPKKADQQPPIEKQDNKAPTTHQNNPKEESLDERRERLKNLSIKLNNPEVLNELENKPAYLRKGVSLDFVDHSSDSNESKWVITDDDEPEIKDNNSFLHDNVD